MLRRGSAALEAASLTCNNILDANSFSFIMSYVPTCWPAGKSLLLSSTSVLASSTA